MNTFPGVRPATPNDIDALRVFVPEILSETTILPLSAEKIEILIDRCAHGDSGAFAGIIDGPHGIDASIGLAFVESETSDIPYISAVWCGLAPAARKKPANSDDPRAHYGRRLFDFARWFHAGMQEAAGHSILVKFDLLTLQNLTPKMGLYQRNLTQVGASFAFGVAGSFVTQEMPAEAEIAEPVAA